MTADNSKVIADAMQSKKHSTKKLTIAEFIVKSIAKHGDKYDYSSAIYINNTQYLKIICPEHGMFEQTPKQHLRGLGCTKCAIASRVNKRRKNRDQVILDFKKVHGEKYLYHKVEYISAMQKVCIVCPDHSEFWQTPADHQAGHGCPKCKSNITSKIFRKGKAHFLKKFKEAHGDKYNYSLVDGNLTSKDIIKILCKKHGVFEQMVMSHALGYGCKKCGGVHRHDTKSFVEISNKVHKGRYNYSKTVYVNNRTKVHIGCPVHGIFKQTPHSHLKGSGCQLCALGLSSHKRRDYIKICSKKDGLSKLYVLKCSKDSEIFYKVGITRKDIRDRFSGSQMPYQYEVIRLIENNAAFIWDLEKQLFRVLKEYRYNPILPFAGRTECFSCISKEVYKLLDKVDKSNQLQLIA